MKKLLFLFFIISGSPGFLACQKERIQITTDSLDLSPKPKPDESREMICYQPEMPYLSGCEDKTTKWARRECTNERIKDIIDSNLRSPTGDCVVGMVVVSFIIREDGTKEQFKIVRSIHPLYEAEALRVVKLIPDFVQVEQFGKVVPVFFHMPVRFTLD